MAYEKKSIRAILDDVNCRRVYLPAIQRKYVWGDNQIAKLMDSIMLGYPIGTFLFWKVKKDVVNKKNIRCMNLLRITMKEIYIRIRLHHSLFRLEVEKIHYGQFLMVNRD